MIDQLMRPMHNLSLATKEIAKGNFLSWSRPITPKEYLKMVSKYKLCVLNPWRDC
jgi:hypothetical protein